MFLGACADGRFTIAAQMLFTLALYQMITAVVTNSPHLALMAQARLLLTIGKPSVDLFL
jgi:hypothetical protein